MTAQLNIDFEPGLTEAFADFMQVLRAAVSGCGVKQESIASKLDYSPSEFSRRISEHGDLPFPAEKLERLLDILVGKGELRPVLYLVEKYLEANEAKALREQQELFSLVRQLQNKLKTSSLSGAAI